jgi:hypothetical protein
VRKKTEGRSEVKYFVCAKIYHKLFQTLLLLLREAFAMFLVLLNAKKMLYKFSMI